MFVNVSYLHSQVSKSIPKGTSIVADGIISQNEWDDANAIQIASAGNKTVRVLFKHNGNALMFAFLDNLGSANFRFPELLLDINNDKSQQWQNDDWWFHVSATNCFHRGAPNIYDNCEDEQPDWEANNFSVELPDTVEIKIPFSLVEMDSNVKYIGMAFDVTNTFNAWEYFPSNADSLNPSTWATGIIEAETSVDNKDEPISDHILNYPNPFTVSITFKYILKEQRNVHLSIYSLLGEEIATLVNERQGQGDYFYNFMPSNLMKGIYIFKFQTGNRIETGKIEFQGN